MVMYADTIRSAPFLVIICTLIPKAGPKRDNQPADAVTISADAHGTFHLPPTTDKRNLR